MLLTRRPEEIFGAEDRQDWEDWVEFFSRTREADGRRSAVDPFDAGLLVPDAAAYRGVDLFHAPDAVWLRSCDGVRQV